MGRRHAAMVCSVLCLGSAARAASAAEADDASRQEPEVRWRDDWRRIHVAEYVVTPIMLGGAFALRFAARQDPEPNWERGIVLDDTVHGALFADDEDTRRGWKIAGDVGFISGFVWSAAEPAIVAGLHGWDVANQLLWMNLEAYAVVSNVLWVSQLIVRRERPRHDTLCGNPGGAGDEDCSGGEESRSFFGGHVATTAAAAGLTCIHHARLPLYGGGAGDVAPCATGVLATGLVFAARTVTGAHYLSDNVLGLGVGAAAALIPTAIHYGFSDGGDAARHARDDRRPPLERIYPGLSSTGDGGAVLEMRGLF
jgi:hypothetical protein